MYEAMSKMTYHAARVACERARECARECARKRVGLKLRALIQHNFTKTIEKKRGLTCISLENYGVPTNFPEFSGMTCVVSNAR